MSKFFLAILALISGVSSSPLLEEEDCTVTSYEEVNPAAKICKNLVLNNITVPAKQVLQIDLLPGASLTFEGIITWEHDEWEGPLMSITGSNVQVFGDEAVLDGQGAQWWDNNGDDGKIKPKLFRVQTTGGSVLQNINIINCPRQCVSINGASDTTLDNFQIDITDGDSGGAKNTDGFDVSGSNIIVQNSVVANQDDCVAINQGFNLYFFNLTCIGGHGLSLSVGKSSSSGSANTVENVTFTDCSVINSDNGIHVKPHSDAGNGSVIDINYVNIQLYGIRKYGINIEQDYENGRPTGNAKSNIPIQQLTIGNVSGSMDEDSEGMAVSIFCGSEGCSDWNWSNVTINNAKKYSQCNFIPSGYDC